MVNLKLENKNPHEKNKTLFKTNIVEDNLKKKDSPNYFGFKTYSKNLLKLRYLLFILIIFLLLINPVVTENPEEPEKSEESETIENTANNEHIKEIQKIIIKVINKGRD